MTKKKVFVIHPGEILREEFMNPLKLSSYQLAKDLHLPIPRVHDIVRERRAITADTAVRLAKYFGMPAEFWLGLQADYDIRLAKGKLEKVKIKPNPRTAAA
jgi:addiction module HigA family antidote